MDQIEDIREIRKIIQAYLDCWLSKDEERFSALFHERFLMTGRRGSEFVFSGVDAMLPRLKNSDATWSKHVAEICHIQCAGPIATAEIEEFGFLDIEVRATSYFQLIKENGQWRFIAKTFHYHHPE